MKIYHRVTMVFVVILAIALLPFFVLATISRAIACLFTCLSSVLFFDYRDVKAELYGCKKDIIRIWKDILGLQ